MLINFYFDETMLHLFTLNFIQLKRHDICTVPCSKTQRSSLSGYYSIHNNTRIKSQGCFGILSSLAFQWALKLCNYHQK